MHPAADGGSPCGKTGELDENSWTAPCTPLSECMTRTGRILCRASHHIKSELSLQSNIALPRPAVPVASLARSRRGVALLVLLLMALMAQPGLSGRPHRLKRAGDAAAAICQPQLVQINITYRNCPVHAVLVPACRGLCQSSSRLDLNHPQRLVTQCSCCSELEILTYPTLIECPSRRDRFSIVKHAFNLTIPLACACRPCSG